MKNLMLSAALLLAAGTAIAADDQMTVVPGPADVKWADGPPTLPKGTKVAVLSGSPAQEGLFVMRLMLPADAEIKPHTHPGRETVTVLQGAFNIGMGEAFDRAKTTKLDPGGMFSFPPGHAHFAYVATDTVVQLNGFGPWKLTYVNPADAPGKQ